MRTEPLADSLQFRIGDTPDHDALGAAKYLLMLLYAALLIGSIAIAAANLSRDPAQRNVRSVTIWLIRLSRIGAGWPWNSLFCAFLHGFFGLEDAGRSLGLDAILARRRAEQRGGLAKPADAWAG